MCAEVNRKSFNEIHHEMGHIEYAMAYHAKPLPYRTSVNAGFHEAIGDLIALSVNTEAHLKAIDLIKGQTDMTDVQIKKQEINTLMGQALRIVASLPFAYMVDKWRWGVFDGSITSANYNREWWKLRLKYQGVVPPVQRSETDFDPGALIHIPWSVPYLRYFISDVLTFQFYEAMCAGAGHTGPLHKCDFYQSKEAGKKLKNMLALGASKPWPEVMKIMTGQREMSTRALLKYFKPLIEWLEKVNEGKDVEWMTRGQSVESVISEYFD